MDKVKSLEELLPNFEQFLEDLSSIKLTSDLERRVKSYKQRIKLHIEQHSTQPGNVPPKLPGSYPPLLKKRLKDSDTAPLSPQKVISRQTAYSSSGGSIPVDEDNIYEEEDFYLEPATADQPPPLPSTERPAWKTNSPGKKVSPEEEGQMYYDFEKVDAPARIIDDEEEQLLYQDVDDDNYDDDFSDSTDFEEVGEGGQVTSTIQIKPKKTSKFDLFQEQFAEDGQVDMIGELFYCNMSGTISTRLINKWVKKYCVARDMHLLCHSAPKKKASLDIPLPGHTVNLMARSSGKKNVLVVNHPSKGDQMFSCRSKEEAERWLEILQDYATMGHEIVPNSGYINKVECPAQTKAKEKEKKKQKKKDKKKEKVLATPELFIDDKGVLIGNVNLYGVHFGEPKWKKNWISIKDHTFSGHIEEHGIVLFSFDLRKTTIDLADEKESRDNTTLKIGDGDETYVLIEPLNMLDNGKLLKSLMSGITSGGKPEERQKQSGLVSRLMEAFEESQKEPSFYENLRLGKTDRPGSAEVKIPDKGPPPIPHSNDEKKASKSSTLSRFFTSKSATLSPSSAKGDSKSKEKLTPTPSPKASPKKAKTDSGERTPDVVLAGKLTEERTAKEALRKELNHKKKDIRMKKFTLKTDPERDACDAELRAIQKEWNEVNSSLLELDKKIYMANNGISSKDEAEKLKNGDSSAEYTNLPPSMDKRGSVASRASIYNRLSMAEEEKNSSGTVKNMKYLFQAN